MQRVLKQHTRLFHGVLNGREVLRWKKLKELDMEVRSRSSMTADRSLTPDEIERLVNLPREPKENTDQALWDRLDKVNKKLGLK